MPTLQNFHSFVNAIYHAYRHTHTHSYIPVLLHNLSPLFLFRSWCSPLPKGNGYNLSTKIGAQRKVAQSQRAVPLQGHISLTTGQAPNRSDLLTNSLCFLIPISFLQDLAPKTRLPLTPNIVSGFL